MENKIKDYLNKFYLKNDKKTKVVLAIGLIGIVLVFASEIIPDKDEQSKNNQNTEISYSNYSNELEDELKDVISSIDGVGNCNVMITLSHYEENVYATNTQTKNDSESNDYKDEYVLYDSDKGEEPVLIMKYLPQVQGVTVVCSGGDDVIVKEKIIEAVTALFNIPSNRVSVSKINENRWFYERKNKQG